MTTISRDFQRRMPTQGRALASYEAVLVATARILEGQSEAELPSTNRIAAVAGVSVGTLYQYFESRDDILRVLARRHADEMTALLFAHAAPAAAMPPREAIPAFVDAIVEAHRIAPRLHLALTRAMLLDGGELLAAHHDPARAIVRAWLEEHRASLRPSDLDAAAFLLTTTVEAAVHGWIMFDPPRLGDATWRRELADLCIRYLLP
jgi:AcrR family transcriptional regulator